MSVTELFDELKNRLPSVRFALLHGKMKDKEKAEIMQNFKAKKFDCLVSTTVIEVGVDVPDATIMIVYNAERFGLSQLHQLRGRVGRGSKQSYCFLLLGADGEEARARLAVLKNNTDGFKIAEYDLEMRGSGDFLGTRQSGLTVEGADDFRPFLTKRFGLFEFLGRKASSGRQRHDIHAVGHIGEKAAPADRSLVRIVEPDDRPIMVAVLVGAERGEVTGIQSGIVFAENRVFDCDFLVLRPVVARGARRCCEQKRRAAEYVAYRSFHDSNDNGLFLLAVPPQTGGHVVGSPEQ